MANMGVMPGDRMKWNRFWSRCQTKLFALRFRFFWLGNSDKFTFLGDSHLEAHFDNRKINQQLGMAWQYATCNLEWLDAEQDTG